MTQMRIALTADPELPVPPELYGGIERIVDGLARGLVARGHDVTLFANRRSNTAGRLVAWPGASSGSKADTLRNGFTLAREHLAHGFDVVHSFSRVAYLLPIIRGVPKLMTYQRPVTPRTVRLGLAMSGGSLHFCAISRHMLAPVEEAARWHVVPNAVSLSTYSFKTHVEADAPLVFLGRIEEIKGPHLAIDVARRTGIPLVIAGNIPAGHEAWFEANVRPHVDGRLVSYVGPVNDAQKNGLLGRARAFLMPILWEEPFGIVMAEALACGTPVIGLRRGSVPEVVVDGVTGFVCDTLDDMVAAAGRIGRMSREACRARAESEYGMDVMVERYLTIYRAIARRPQ